MFQMLDVEMKAVEGGYGTIQFIEDDWGIFVSLGGGTPLFRDLRRHIVSP